MTSWTSFAIETGDEPAPTIVFSAGETVYAPAAQRDRVAAAMKAIGFEPKPGRWLDLVDIGDAGERVLVIAIGSENDADRWRNAGGHVVEATRALMLARTRMPAASELGIGNEFVRLLEGVLLHGYRLDQDRRDPIPGHFPSTLLVANGDAALIEEAQRLAGPVNRARAWVEQPANLLTPAAFADEAEAALVPLGVTVRKLGPAELEAMGARGILAVAAGSENEPRLTVAEWRGAPDRESWDAALVGKGLTFDAGGLNLKARPSIAKMKFDMAGAAAVLGAIERLAARKAPVNIVAVVPMSENNIDGKAFRPGDLIKSMSGLTIDVQDTDAEGRIVLADGITYATEHYDPDCIVDVATLTGLMMGLLHEEFAGLFTSDDVLADDLTRAGAAAQELLWRLPLVAAQDYLVESPVADVSNVGAPGWFGVGAGSPVAGAKFIEKFAKGRRWAHIDIAGTAWATRRSSRCGPGATGFGVDLLDRWADLFGERAKGGAGE
jgi:leucyl aminopeptidase